MRDLTYLEALQEALREEMRRDSAVFLMGEDVRAAFGNPVPRGFFEEFGEERVRDTPISETAIIGAAIGAAMTDMRPVAEIIFEDLLPICMDQIVNQAAKLRYMSGGQIKLPLVIRTQGGMWGSLGAQHSQSLHAWFMHTPGLKLALPSSPYDAKGLLKTAIRDDNPVVFLEHKYLYKVKGPVPEEEYFVPFGVADTKRTGKDLTMVATSYMVQLALQAAEQLAAEGIEATVIDPRTLVPLDRQTIVESVKSTNRVVIVDEGCRTGSVAAELSAMITEEAFDYLDAPIARVGTKDLPMPFSPPLEAFVVPKVEDIIQAAKSVMA